MEFRDAIQILRLNPSAINSEIKTAYRNMAKIYHPDAPQGDADIFIRIKAAYEVAIQGAPEPIYTYHSSYSSNFNAAAANYYYDYLEINDFPYLLLIFTIIIVILAGFFIFYPIEFNNLMWGLKMSHKGLNLTSTIKTIAEIIKGAPAPL